jgi:Divergent InlB B-repeat domain
MTWRSAVRLLALLLAASLLPVTSLGITQVFGQPHNGSGTVYKSAWYPPDGLDGDQYTYDNFTIGAGAAITEIHWRGGYTNYLQGAGRAPVFDFDISIYGSIGGNSQPNLGDRRAHYSVGGNAGEVLAGTFGGVQLYDYTYTLPAAFQAAPGVTYWILIEASQGVTPQYGWPPDWGYAAGSGGNNSHFTQITGGPTFSTAGDLCFSLWTSDAPTVTITASASPAGAGLITGAGAYPIGTTASLQATPNAGWGFVNWTESGTQVSTNAHYTFTATVNRTLVGHFVPAYTITTGASPSFGGSTGGDGVFNSGASVTVTATANPGFVFQDWSEFGTPVSTSAAYTFTVSADRVLVADFAAGPLSEFFDFDNAPFRSPLPIDLTSGYVTAHFAGTGQGYSIQRADTMGFTPIGFAGLCIYPSSIYASDLQISFSTPLSDFSIMFADQELACDSTALMRVRAYRAGVEVGTSTARAPSPGTWPTGTLRISVPSGFDTAVVHFDTPGTLCQDWGPIFMADNMVVTRTCAAPVILASPTDESACTNGWATFHCYDDGTLPRTYQWQREAAPGSFVNLPEGSTTPWDGGGAGVGATVSGTRTAVMTIAAASGEGGSLGYVHSVRYRCVVTNPCGTIASAGAKLYVNSADFNNDGDIGTDADIEAFFACLAGNCCATCGSADFNGDGDVGTDADIEAFFRVLAGGAC